MQNHVPTLQLIGWKPEIGITQEGRKIHMLLQRGRKEEGKELPFYFEIKRHRETKCVKEEIGTGRRIRKTGRGKAVIAST